MLLYHRRLFLLLVEIAVVTANSQIDAVSTLANNSSENAARNRAQWSGSYDNIWSLNSRAPIIDCNFDSTKPCSTLVQSMNDDAEWRIRLNRTTVVNSTNGGVEFMHSGFIEAISGPWIRPGTIVRLRSSQLLPPRSGYCLRFTYRFIGENVGALTIGILDSYLMRSGNTINGADPMTGESAMHRIWFKAGPMLPEWFYANVSFASQYSFKIIFEAMLLGPNNPGSIALDSISLQNDYCLDFVDADIVVNPNAVNELTSRNGQLDSPVGDDSPNSSWLPLDSRDSLWPDAIVPYEIDPAFSDEDQLTILGAFEEYHNRTCIRWIRRTNEVSYISIVNGATGCWSFVGRQGGKQLVNFDTTRPCIQHYVIVHELAHSLGLIHEQSRSDRDNFVDILWSNIQPGFQHNFKKYDREVLSTLRQPYDFDSVMHYPNNAFAKLPALHTLEARGSPGRKLGNQDGLSELDAKKLRTAYNCGDFDVYDQPVTTARPTTQATFRRPPYPPPQTTRVNRPIVATSTPWPIRPPIWTPAPTYRPPPPPVIVRTTTTTTTTRRTTATTPVPPTTARRTTTEPPYVVETSDESEAVPGIIDVSQLHSSTVGPVTTMRDRLRNELEFLGQNETGELVELQMRTTPTLSYDDTEERLANIACGLPSAESASPAILTLSYGYIASPNFNQGFYPPNSHCKWRIVAPPNKIIRLTFLTLQLTTSPNCHNDRLVVYDGANDTSSNILGVFCGLFASPPVSSSTNALLVQFTSDPTWEANGFELFYEVVEPDVECIAGRPIPDIAVLPATNPTTLCLGMRFTCSGSIVRWEFYSGRDDGGDVYLGVFRLISSNKYYFVGANMRRAFRKGFNQFYVPIDSQIFAQEGDFIGVFYADPHSGPVISVNELQTLKRTEVAQTVCLQAYVYKSMIETEMSKAGFIDLQAFASPVVPAVRAVIQGTCGAVPTVRNAYYSSDEPVSATVGSSVTFTCEAGYHLVGSSVIDCLSSKRWNDAPFCEEEHSSDSLQALSELDCSFHGSLCNWQADTPTWQLSAQEEEFDFAYILTGYLAGTTGPDWLSTRLVSPEMTMPILQKPSCFHLFTRMEGFYYQPRYVVNVPSGNNEPLQTPDTLVVLMSTSKGERPVQVIQPQSDPVMSSDWHLVNVEINEDGPFKIILEIRQGRGRLGSVSLASTKLTLGSCPDANNLRQNATVVGYEMLDGNCPGNLMPLHLHCPTCSVDQCAVKCTQQGADCAGFSYSDLQDNRCYLKTTSCSMQQASPYVFYEKIRT